MKPAPLLFACLALSVYGCGEDEPARGDDADGAPAAELRLPDGVDQLRFHAGEVAYGACAPGLPPGCEIAVLEGDPQAPGLFTVRFRLSDEFMMPPHTHPKEERVTVLSGRMAVAFGDGAGREAAAVFGPGDYYVNARNAVHSVWAEETAVIQITGVGPWEADFISN